MVNFGSLAAEIGSLVWGTPANFNGFRVLASLLHGSLVLGVSQTAALNRGRHLYSAGRSSPLSRIFTARRNARIASVVLAIAIPYVRPSVCQSHAGIVSKRRHVARCSLHCWIAKCVQLCRNQKNIPQRRPLRPEILAPSDLSTPEGSEF